MTTYIWCENEWNITIIAKCRQSIGYSICFTDITWWSYCFHIGPLQSAYLLWQESLVSFASDQEGWRRGPVGWRSQKPAPTEEKEEKQNIYNINTRYNSNKIFPRQSPVPLKWSFTGLRMFTMRLSLTVFNFRLWTWLSSSPCLHDIPNPIFFYFTSCSAISLSPARNTLSMSHGV